MVLYIIIPLEEATVEKLWAMAQIPEPLLITCCVPDLSAITGLSNSWLSCKRRVLVLSLHRQMSARACESAWHKVITEVTVMPVGPGDLKMMPGFKLYQLHY